MDKFKKQKTIRKAVQSVWSIVTNANIKGFIIGNIYRGPLKRFCVPGMNCYACPGAIMSCPIGSIQAVFGQKKPQFAFYVIGFLSFIGVLVGRFVCGWLCLFGLLQELLYKIPIPKIEVNKKIDHILRFFKYIFLFGFCILAVIILKNKFGISLPYFCKYICPIGMLEGGIPLVILNEELRATIGLLYAWKFLILVVIILLSIIIYRPFCKYICPLGAFYSLFQKVSFLKLHLNKGACVNCGACYKSCKMQVNPTLNPNSSECIRCGECVSICQQNALTFSFLQNHWK